MTAVAVQSGPAGACPPHASEGRSGLLGPDETGEPVRTTPSGEVGFARFGGAPGTRGRSRKVSHARPDHACVFGACCGCGDAHGDDQYGLSTPTGEHGFCGGACMSIYVRRTYIECDTRQEAASGRR